MLSFIESIFRKFVPVQFRFPAFALGAFISVLSFMQINSAWADKHHANGLWWALGIVFGLWTIAIAVIYYQDSSSDFKGR